VQLIENYQIKKDLPDLCVGDRTIVTIYLELPKEQDEGEKKEKERTQAYEGVIISKHRNTKEPNATITVRKVSQEVGIEKVFLLNSPWIKNIQIISRARVRRAKLYYLRQRTGKSARLKRRF
jgi:large subunit ribosomal protein L19